MADNMFPEDSDGEVLAAAAAGGGDDEASLRSASVTAVCVKGCEKIICRLCNAKAMDAGPSAKLDPDGKYGGYWPWAQYINIKEDDVIVARQPIGRVCAPCRNVFNLTGLHAKYGSITKFAKCLQTPEGAKLHTDFVKKSQGVFGLGPG